MNDNHTNYTNHYMIEFDKAFQLITEHASIVENEIINLSQAKGRILAQDVNSPVAIPPFDNSAMDGYAVNYQDIVDASSDSPVTLELAGLTAAGDPPSSKSQSKNTAWKIMTGAPVPRGYDAVIPVENTKLQQQTVSCFSPTKANAHIRTRGEDFLEGDRVLNKNCFINANRIMALASLGISKVSVKTKPKIAVFSTGKELVDNLSQPLESGQIYNSNMPYIIESLKHLPVNVYNAGTNYDDVEAYQKALESELQGGANLIISTGAVSMGDFDFIPQTIIKMGGEIIFHKARIRPGKPVLFARFPNGSYYFGLPGNPISAAIGLRFFVKHLINIMLGVQPEVAKKGKIREHRTKKLGFTNILKAHSMIENGELVSDVLTGQESFKIHPLIDANSWVVLPADNDSVKQGQFVDIYPSDLTIESLF